MKIIEMWASIQPLYNKIINLKFNQELASGVLIAKARKVET